MIKIETFPKHVLKAFFRSFKNIAPVRVLIKIVDPEVLPLKVPSNVLMQAWLPQLQILSNYSSSIALFSSNPTYKQLCFRDFLKKLCLA